MNLSSLKTNGRLMLAVGVILFGGIFGYSIFSVVRAMREPGLPGTALLAPLPAVPAPVPDMPEPALPAAAHVPDMPPASVAPATAGNAQSFSTEFELIRQREQERKELMENLRKQARENPGAPGTLSKEQIDALEKSGDSLM